MQISKGNVPCTKDATSIAPRIQILGLSYILGNKIFTTICDGNTADEKRSGSVLGDEGNGFKFEVFFDRDVLEVVGKTPVEGLVLLSSDIRGVASPGVSVIDVGQAGASGGVMNLRSLEG
jgi:hypothetical protein